MSFVLQIPLLKHPRDSIVSIGAKMMNQGRTLAYNATNSGIHVYKQTVTRASNSFYDNVFQTIGTIVVEMECDWEQDTFETNFTPSEKAFLLSSYDQNKEVNGYFVPA